MNENSNYAEYTVAQKSEGKYKVRRILAILGYIAFTILYSYVFLGLIKFWPLISILPIFVWLVYHYTWPLVSVEYEYIIESGTMKFINVYGGKKKKEVISFKVKDCELIAPATDEYKDKFNASFDRTFDFRGSATSPDSYFAIVPADGRKTLVFFEATAKSVKVMYYYNSTNTIKSTTLRY